MNRVVFCVFSVLFMSSFLIFHTNVIWMCPISTQLLDSITLIPHGFITFIIISMLPAATIDFVYKCSGNMSMDDICDV